MQRALISRPPAPVWFIGALLVALITLAYIVVAPRVVVVPVSSDSTHYLAKGTEGLLKQTAAHLSKMNKGASVGGFPGFEPPEDDKKYRSKVNDGNFNAQDVNDWVKEINNFLRQIVQKNPRMTLEEILQKQGLTAEQIANFSDTLRNVEVMARSMKHYGVAPETAETLTALMETLGAVPWP